MRYLGPGDYQGRGRDSLESIVNEGVQDRTDCGNPA
jgi:hypothetical protein